jgi:glycogen debranching enzyme
MELEGRRVGVMAATDDGRPHLNYDQCFVRDFAVCASVFLLRGDTEIVRNFLVTVLGLQSREHALEVLQPRKGLMPASFGPATRNGERLLRGDYGEASIARVTPADSVFWWLLTLRAYTKFTGDNELADREEFQEGIRLILRLVLEGSFEMFPTLLVPDGAFMIDRRMGVYGHPLEVQALFFAALRASLELLSGSDGLRESVERRLRNLRDHVGRFYWLDRAVLSNLREVGRDQYGEDAANVFNVFPESIPSWIDTWLPTDGGYFAGNVGPGRIDFRFFTQGNFLAVAAGLCGADRAGRLLHLVDSRWTDLVGSAPLRIVYPALEDEAWRLITGADAKNAPWHYHNGGCWPCLLWSFASATVACRRTDLLERALEAAESRFDRDRWPEYYDGQRQVRPGDRARRRQSWSMAAYLYAKECLRDAAHAELYVWPDEIDPEAVSADPG